MSKHLPTPYRIEPYVDAIDIVDANGCKVAGMDDASYAGEDIGGYVQPMDNARFIVRACNAHDVLVRALKYAEEFLCQNVATETLAQRTAGVGGLFLLSSIRDALRKPGEKP